MDLRLRLYQAHIQTLLSTELHVSSSLPLTSPCTPHHELHFCLHFVDSAKSHRHATIVMKFWHDCIHQTYEHLFTLLPLDCCSKVYLNCLLQ